MNAPKLRFKEFNDEWSTENLSKVVTFSKGNSLSKSDLDESGPYPCILYGELYTKYHEVIRKVFSKTNYNSDNIVKSKYGDILIPASGETPIDISTSSCLLLDNILVGGDINILSPKNCDGRFISYVISNNKRKSIARVAQGHSIVHLYSENLKKIKLDIPSLKEQKKIADMLELLDKKIELQIKKIEALKLFKKGLISKLLNEYDYKIMKIKDVLKFEQPTKYIVNSDDYINDSKAIPVLTANKAFILGYCNENNFYDKGDSIIFDDFTMDMKYTNFNYKVKSSAIKILTAKGNNDLRFLYELLLSLNLKSEEHKRHYISIVQELDVKIPSVEVQKSISSKLELVDNKILFEEKFLNNLTKLKKGFMQSMFV